MTAHTAIQEEASAQRRGRIESARVGCRQRRPSVEEPRNGHIVSFATSMATPDHVELAEQLGYRRAWLYDSPALYPDVWMILGFCAERTSRIGLGPGVLVPSLRHPMVNAAAIAALQALAPGRVAVAVGAGFTGRRALGQRPMRWSEVADYVRVLRQLLRGEETEWAGAAIQMLHMPGFGASRPLHVPILMAAMGPKGTAVAESWPMACSRSTRPTPKRPRSAPGMRC